MWLQCSSPTLKPLESVAGKDPLPQGDKAGVNIRVTTGYLFKVSTNIYLSTNQKQINKYRDRYQDNNY